MKTSKSKYKSPINDQALDIIALMNPDKNTKDKKKNNNK